MTGKRFAITNKVAPMIETIQLRALLFLQFLTYEAEDQEFDVDTNRNEGINGAAVDAEDNGSSRCEGV